MYITLNNFNCGYTMQNKLSVQETLSCSRFVSFLEIKNNEQAS